MSRFPAFRVAIIAMLCVTSITSVLSVGVAEADEARVRPSRWAKQFCAETQATVEEVLADSKTWPELVDPLPLTLEEVRARAEAMDQGIEALARIIGAMQESARRAGVPAVRRGPELMELLDETLDEVLDRFERARAALRRFVRETETDATGAAERLSDALDDALGDVEKLFSDGQLSPRLERAIDRSRACDHLYDTIDEVMTFVRPRL